MRFREFQVLRTLNLPYNKSNLVLVKDELTRSIQEEVPCLWCMLFADDIAPIDETWNKVNARLEV